MNTARSVIETTLVVTIVIIMTILALLSACDVGETQASAKTAPFTEERTEDEVTEPEAKRAEMPRINREAKLQVYEERPTETEAPETEPVPEKVYRFYAISGDELDRDLARYLQDEMEINGIPEEHLTDILCQAYQESSFNTRCLTPYPGGNDCGLFQFRDRYFGDYLALAGYPRDTDIMNPYVQIDIFCLLYGKRIRSGQSIEKTISDWMTGGYTDEIIEEYVADVLGWRTRIVEIP